MAFTDRLANRGSISTGYDIENSLRVQHTSNEYLYRDNPTSGNRRTFTFSFWLKRASVSVPAINYLYDQYFMSQGANARFHFAGNTIRFMFDGNSTEMEATQQLRDCSAWYHIVLAVDTTQATNTNRVKAYLNGNAYEWSNSDWPAQNAESQWMHDQDLYLATGYSDAASNDLSGYLADVIVVDGQQLTPSSFGETDEDSGIWKPKKFTGSFGDEGVWLKFDDSSSMGADSSGNSNNFTLTNIAAVNQTTDTPTNNFCTLNPNDRTVSTTYDGELINGMLEYQPESGTSMVRGTMGMSSGKWYWEVKLATYAGQNVGICTTNMDIPVTSTQEGGFVINSEGGDSAFFSLYANSHYRSYFVYDGSNSNSASAFASGTFTYGDIFGFAFDADNLDIYISKKGSWTDVKASQDPEGDPGSNTAYVYHASLNTDEDDTWLPFASNSYNQDMIWNFGNPIHSISSSNADANGYGNFEYAVPSGYYALCTKNLSEFG